MNSGVVAARARCSSGGGALMCPLVGRINHLYNCMYQWAKQIWPLPLYTACGQEAAVKVRRLILSCPVCSCQWRAGIHIPGVVHAAVKGFDRIQSKRMTNRADANLKQYGLDGSFTPNSRISLSKGSTRCVPPTMAPLDIHPSMVHEYAIH